MYADPNLTLTKGGLNVSCVRERSVFAVLIYASDVGYDNGRVDFVNVAKNNPV